MRTLMTLLTLGSAAGYLYLQQPSVEGQSDLSVSLTSAICKWTSVSTAQADRVPVNELVNRIHEHTRSVLDDFANQHGGHSDAPVDDAFERLRQVAQNIATAASCSDDSCSIGDDQDASAPNSVPIRHLDELRRTAFEPAAVNDSPVATKANQTAQDESLSRDESHESTPVATASKPDESKSAAAEHPNDSVTLGDAVPLGPTASNASQVVRNESASRPIAKTISNRTPTYISADWKVVGKSTEGRPMHTMHLGDRGVRTLVIAGLNGDEPTSVRWLELLSDELRRRPELFQSNEVLLFRAGNPDGLTRKMRNNVRGVPINRNFPSRRYQPAFGSPAFAPGGEAETRVILETLYSFRPRRVIHLGSISGRSQVSYNRLAKKIAEEFERTTKLTPRFFDPEQFPGSLEDFADGTLEAAVLSMRLSVDNDWRRAWDKLQFPVLSVVVGQTVTASGEEKVQPADPDRSPIPPTNEDLETERPQRRGYEELPPPPDQE